jgi:hypothetical protein
MKTLRFFVEIGDAFQEALVNSCFFVFVSLFGFHNAGPLRPSPSALKHNTVQGEKISQNSAWKQGFPEHKTP